jgi:hypothetical protein
MPHQAVDCSGVVTPVFCSIATYANLLLHVLLAPSFSLSGQGISHFCMGPSKASAPILNINVAPSMTS